MITSEGFYAAYHEAVIELLEALARHYDVPCRIAKNDAVGYVVLKLNAFVFSEFAVQVGMTKGRFEVFYQDEDGERHYAAVDDLDALSAHLDGLMPAVRAVYERQSAQQRRWMDGLGDPPET